MAAVSGRIRWIRVARAAIRGAATGFAAACIIAVAIRWFPIPNDLLLIGIMPVLVTIVFAAAAFFRKPAAMEAAITMDAAGLEERMRTAAQYAADNSPVAKLQRHDAVRVGERFVMELTERMPVKVEQKVIGIASVFLLLLLTVQFAWPNPMREQAAQQKTEKKWLAKMELETKQLSEQWQKQGSSSAIALSMEEALQALDKDLVRSESAKSGLDRIEKTLSRLQELTQQELQRQNALDQRLQQAAALPALQSVSSLLAAGKAEGMKEAVDQLQRQLVSMSDSDRTKVADQLDQLAAEAAQSGPAGRSLQEGLRRAADELRGAGDPLSTEAEQQLNQALEAAAQEREKLLEQLAAAQSTAAGLAQAALPMAQQLAAPGAALSPAWSAGSSSGAGAGSSGAGAGDGSRSLITTPRSVTGDGTHQEADTGPVTSGSGEMQQGGRAPASSGTMRKYEDVYQTYADEASRSLDRNELPQSVQNLVKDYFLDIQPNR